MFTPRSAAPPSIIRPRRADATGGAADKSRPAKVSVEQRATARFTPDGDGMREFDRRFVFAYAINYLVEVDAIIVDIEATTAICQAEILQQSA
jgi:hypothetical protein